MLGEKNYLKYEENIRTRISGKQKRKIIEKINNTKSCFFKNVNKIDKHLARLTKRITDYSRIKMKEGALPLTLQK